MAGQTDRLNPQLTAALLERVALGLSNAEIAALAGTERVQTVSDWKARGMPRAAAALMVHRIALQHRREADAAAQRAAAAERALAQFQLE